LLIEARRKSKGVGFSTEKEGGGLNSQTTGHERTEALLGEPPHVFSLSGGHDLNRGWGKKAENKRKRRCNRPSQRPRRESKNEFEKERQTVEGPARKKMGGGARTHEGRSHVTKRNVKRKRRIKKDVQRRQKGEETGLLSSYRANQIIDHQGGEKKTSRKKRVFEANGELL